MADRYVRSTTGNTPNNGSSWALAKQTLAGVAAIDAAGDIIYVSQAHNGTSASSTYNFAGTSGNPVYISCVDDALATPENQLATAVETVTTGASFFGSFYMQGITYIVSSSGTITLAANTSSSDHQVFENCTFIFTSTGNLNIGTTTVTPSTKVRFINCWVKFTNSSSQLAIYASNFEWIGGGFLSGTAFPASYNINVANGARAIHCLFSNLEFQGCSAIVRCLAGKAVFRSCYAAGEIALYAPSGPVSGVRFEKWACWTNLGDYGESGGMWRAPTPVAMGIYEDVGSIDAYGDGAPLDPLPDAGGAEYDGSRYAWIMQPGNNPTVFGCPYPAMPLVSPNIARWNDTVGTPITVAVEFLPSNTSPQKHHLWLEVEYYGVSGTVAKLLSARPNKTLSYSNPANIHPLGTLTWSGKASYFGADIASVQGRRLEATLTPQEPGLIVARVVWGYALGSAYPLFIDPALRVV